MCNSSKLDPISLKPSPLRVKCRRDEGDTVKNSGDWFIPELMCPSDNFSILAKEKKKHQSEDNYPPSSHVLEQHSHAVEERNYSEENEVGQGQAQGSDSTQDDRAGEACLTIPKSVSWDEEEPKTHLYDSDCKVLLRTAMSILEKYKSLDRTASSSSSSIPSSINSAEYNKPMSVVLKERRVSPPSILKSNDRAPRSHIRPLIVVDEDSSKDNNMNLSNSLAKKFHDNDDKSKPLSRRMSSDASITSMSSSSSVSSSTSSTSITSMSSSSTASSDSSTQSVVQNMMDRLHMESERKRRKVKRIHTRKHRKRNELSRRYNNWHMKLISCPNVYFMLDSFFPHVQVDSDQQY